MKHRSTTLLLLLLSSVFAFSQIRGEITNTVAGTLRNAHGKPVADARVELHSIKNSQVIASGYTNQLGGFEFPNIAVGHYDLVAINGLNEASEQINVPGASNVELVIQDNSGSVADAGDANTVSVAQFKVPSKARNLYKKAEAAARKQKFDEVTKYLDQALEVYPNFAEALTLRGIIKMDASQPQAAIEDLEKAIQADSSAAMSYLVLGAAYNMMKRFDDALRISDHGVALKPSAWQGYFEMAKSYLGKADYQKALAQVDKAIPLAPSDYAPLHLVKAHALLALKSYADAMSELQAFLDKAPKNDPNTSDAVALMNQTKAFLEAKK